MIAVSDGSHSGKVGYMGKTENEYARTEVLLGLANRFA